jgi:hypothetical protein
MMPSLWAEKENLLIGRHGGPLPMDDRAVKDAILRLICGWSVNLIVNQDKPPLPHRSYHLARQAGEILCPASASLHVDHVVIDLVSEADRSR